MKKSNFLNLIVNRQNMTYLIIIILIVTYLFFENLRKSYHIKVDENCYKNRHKFADLLIDDIMENAKKPTPGKSIFFHETSCSADGLIRINAR